MKLFHKAMNEFLFALGVMLQCATGLPFEKPKLELTKHGKVNRSQSKFFGNATSKPFPF